MPIRLAMPIAHVTGASAYGPFYTQAGASIMRVAAYFNQGLPLCEGLRLERDPAGPAAVSANWDLFAFTDGFLSFQNTCQLVLRLPLELKSPAAVKPFNSGRLFGALRPEGPQLRHVVYYFPAVPPASAVETKLRSLLNDATHPMRTIVKVRPTGQPPQTLGAYIAAAPGNLDLFLASVMAGTAEMFVRAGEVIGNFETQSIELRFIDSCANPVTFPAEPGGRSLNPAYYLSLVRLAANNQAGAAGRVMMTTALSAPVPNPPTTTHPLDFLLDTARAAAAGAPADVALVLGTTTPAKPLHIHVNVTAPGGQMLATTGIPMRGLGNLHQSRNAANPFSTKAPVKWRLVGNLPADTTAADFGLMITEVVTGKANRLPGPGAFDHTFAPGVTQADRVDVYWTRYAAIFNAVATAYDIPIELLVAIACSETSTGAWYNATFANSHEMDIIRMEPLPRTPATITADAAKQALLNNYSAMTGGVGGNGANANIPVPWSGATAVKPANALTWDQLKDLMNDFPGDVRASPGIMQELVTAAKDDLAWTAAIYGAAFVSTISIMSGGVALTADAPPAGVNDIFKDWFGVSVDAMGANTTVAANVHAGLTQLKRAMHGIIAGGAHIKRSYNSGHIGSNRICDFDLPTVVSGYNDGAGTAKAAAAVDSNDTKWKKLFALIFFDKNYPQLSPRYYNAAVAKFNAVGVAPLPSIRIWKG